MVQSGFIVAVQKVRFFCEAAQCEPEDTLPAPRRYTQTNARRYVPSCRTLHALDPTRYEQPLSNLPTRFRKRSRVPPWNTTEKTTTRYVVARIQVWLWMSGTERASAIDKPPRKPPQLSVRREDLCPGCNSRTKPRTNMTTRIRTTMTEIIASPPDSKERRVKGMTSTSKPSRTK